MSQDAQEIAFEEVQTATVIEPQANTEILKLVQDSGLEKTKQNVIAETLGVFFNKASEWDATIKSIVITSPTETGKMKMAKEGRLTLKNMRLEAEKVVKAKREEVKAAMADFTLEDKLWLKAGQMMEATFKNLETKLEEKEKFAERWESEQKEKTRAARLELLTPFTDQAHTFPLADMAEDAFADLLSGMKSVHEKRIEDARLAEENRLAEEQKERERQIEIEAENKRLKAEAEAREKELAAEREKAEAERKAQEAKADAERKAAAELLAKQQAEAKAEQEKSAQALKAQQEAADRQLQAEREQAKAKEEAAEKERIAVRKRMQQYAMKDLISFGFFEDADGVTHKNFKWFIGRSHFSEFDNEAEMKLWIAGIKERLITEQDKADAGDKLQQAQAEQARIAAELAAKKDAEDKAAADKIHADKLAAQAPDKEKLIAYAAKLGAAIVPEMSTDATKKIAAHVKGLLGKIEAYIIEQTNKL